MPQNSFFIRGTITDTVTGTGAPGLRIVLTERSSGVSQVLVSDDSAADGSYRLDLTAEQMTQLFAPQAGEAESERDQIPSSNLVRRVHFEVFDARELVHEFDLSVTSRRFGSDEPLDFSFARPALTGGTNYYTVEGRLTEADGTPSAGVRMRILEVRMRSDFERGLETTDADGKYFHRYTLGTYDPEGPPIVLAIEARDAGTNDLLARSEDRPDPSAREVIDLVLNDEAYRGPSDYTVLSDALTPIVEEEESSPGTPLTLAEVESGDIDYLARRAGVDPVDAARLIKAAKMAASTGVSEVAFYAWARRGVPSSVVAILALDPAVRADALDDAADANQVPEWDPVAKQTALDDIADYEAEATMPTADPSSTLFGSIMTTAGISVSDGQALISECRAHTGTAAQFWSDYATNHPGVNVPRLKFALQAGAFTGNHQPLLAEILRDYDTSTITHVRDLAKRSHADWAALANSRSIGVPTGFPGADPTEQENNYADMLLAVFEDTHPTQAAGARYREDGTVGTTWVDYVDANPTFDLLRTKVDDFVDANTPPVGMDEATVRSELKEAQRLYRVAPRKGRGQTMAALSNAGLPSAHAIVGMGRAGFVAKHGGTTLASREEAQRVFERADQVVATTMSVVGAGGPAFQGPAMAVLPSYDSLSEMQGVADLESLFGDQSYCACRKCRTVLSPAAYLTDAIKWVSDQTNVASGHDQYTALTTRRPDIVETLLNCQNTNTALPKIDLVNEVLERAYSDSSPTEWPQTTWSEEELRAHPEWIDASAYTPLESAFYPWSLPFFISLDEARGYLTHLGAALPELVEAATWGTNDAATIEKIAFERIGFSPGEAVAVTTSPDTTTLDSYWNVPGGGSLPTDVKVFMHRAGVSMPELEALIASRYLSDANVQLGISFATPCTLEGATITTASGGQEEAYARVHRMVRLAHKTGWSIFDTDTALNCLSQDSDKHPDTAFLVDFGDFTRVRERFPRLSKTELLAWFGDAEVLREEAHERSFYERTFVDEDDGGQLWNADLQQVPANDLSVVRDALIAAMRVSDSEMTAIWDWIGAVGTDDNDLNTMSAIFRRASLARAMGMTVHDLIAWKNAIGKDPFTTAGGQLVSPLLDFVESVERMKAAGFTAHHLEYLFQTSYAVDNDVALDDAENVTTFVELLRGLQKIRAEYDGSADGGRPADEVLEALLTQVLPTYINSSLPAYEGNPIEDLIALVRNPSTAATTSPPHFLYAEFLPAASSAPADPLSELHAAVSSMSAPEADVTWRANKILDYLRAHLQRRASQDFVVQFFAERFGLTIDLAETLLAELSPPVGSESAVALFAGETPMPVPLGVPTEPSAIGAADVSDENVLQMLSGTDSASVLDQWFIAARVAAGGTVTAGEPSAEFAVARKLHKISVLLERFNLNEAWTTWLLDPQGSVPKRFTRLGLLDIDGLGGLSPVPDFAGLDNLRMLMAFRDSSLLEPQKVPAMLEPELGSGSTGDVYRDSFYLDTGWDPDEATEYWEPTSSIDVDSIIEFEKFIRLVSMGARLGVSPQTAKNWGTGDVSTVAPAIKAAAKAKYEPDAWATVIEPLRNELREKQRDALVAGLLVDESTGFSDADDISAHYLIDVSTSACTKTSRIKEAVNSVQTYVQRVLLNVENDGSAEAVAFSSEAGREWRWMKRYRVWEANRKIFLYPENWLEPDLRDGKTPLFEALESALLDGELDDDAAEAALIGYLEKLDEIARLKVVATYHDQEKGHGGVSVVDDYHVIARTASTPPVYYHRVRVDDAYWTPWEELPFQIDDERVVVTKYRRRLMVMWPQILTQQEAPVSDNEPGRDYYDIRVFWTQLNHDGWSSPQLSDEIASYKPKLGYDNGFQSEQYTVRPEEFFLYTWKSYDEAELRIRFMAPAHPKVVTDPEQGLIGFIEFVNFHWDATAKAPNAQLGDVLWAADPTTTSGNDWLIRPNGTAIVGQGFEMFENSEAVVLPLRIFDRTGAGSQIGVSTDIVQPPGAYRVVTPRQDQEFIGRRPFVFEDRTRSFFVSSRDKLAAVNDYKGVITIAQDDPDLGETGAFNAGNYLPIGDGNQQPFNPLGNLNIVSVILDPSGGTDSQALDFGLTSAPPTTLEYAFHAFYHPFASDMLGQMRRWGLTGVMAAPEQGEGSDLHRQLAENLIMTGTSDIYHPTSLVYRRSEEDIDFRYGGAYSDYNWELFFHAPMLIADQLMSNGRFEEARRWMHFVFDPTDVGETGTGPQMFWKIKPFYEASEVDAIAKQLEALSYEDSDPVILDRKEELISQISRWRKDPFKPHLIARMRPMAYQRWVVMRYLDLLIGWADSLFRQDTIESNNEAAQLYMLAAEMLGARPVELPELEMPDVAFSTVRDQLDAFSNFMAEIENLTIGAGQGLDEPNDFVFSDDSSNQPIAGAIMFSNPDPVSSPSELGDAEIVGSPPLQMVNSMIAIPDAWPATTGPKSLYFCVPPNSKLLGYWDTVADRLYKLRNCLNIDGVFRQLPLFEPPIDPGLLARAAAAGVDIGAALNDLNAPLPNYRFRTMINVSKEFVADVRGLGSALLSALNSGDAEELAQLRAGHEVSVLDSMTAILKSRIEEAEAQIEALVQSGRAATEREVYYEKLVEKGLLEAEKGHLAMTANSGRYQYQGGLFSALGAALGSIPSFSTGIIGGAPQWSISFGGSNFGALFQAQGAALGAAAGVSGNIASLLATGAGHERRAQDWKFQQGLAIIDGERIAKEKLAAEIRLSIAKEELKVHLQRRENAEQVADYLSDKYTNKELFRWMSSEIKSLYFQAYQLAYDVAKRAERCFRFELGIEDASFIKFGYWDNQRKGLLAGDRLMHDLRRMEAAYLNHNSREYELTKRISLAQLDPNALESLKAGGSTSILLPEWLFDLDHASHYLRRIKSVDVTIPAVTGAFTNVNATLTYEGGSIRRAPIDNGTALVGDLYATVESIATSSGQSDNGLFEGNLNDERYLPFEGKGVVDSNWNLALPTEFPQFDYRTISDVIFTIRYTAREGGAKFGSDRNTQLATKLESSGNQAQLISFKGAFPEAFNDFVTSAAEAGVAASTTFELNESYFPYFGPGKSVDVTNVDVIIWADASGVAPAGKVAVHDAASSVTPDDPIDPIDSSPEAFIATGALEGTPTFADTWAVTTESGAGGWPDGVVPKDLLLVIHYAVTSV